MKRKGHLRQLKLSIVFRPSNACLSLQPIFSLSSYYQATTLEENQNTNEELQPQALPALEVKDTSANTTSQTPIITPEVKKEVPELFSQPQTPNSQLQTDSMEVHKHPHHVMHKKKWNEYLLEFFMLFLAVFLGFVAENIREKITDKQKEKEYMAGVVQDLKSDTAELANAIIGWDRSNSNADSILFYLKKEMSPSNVNLLYNLLNRNFFHFNLFKYNDKTIQELKSSGGFRLVRKREIANSMMAFDVDMKYILTQEGDIREFMMETKKMESKIFDFSQFNGNQSDYDQLNGNTSLLLLLNARKEISNGTLLTTDKQIIDEYYNVLYTFQLISRYHTYLFREEKKKATLLLQQIQEQYHLEDE